MKTYPTLKLSGAVLLAGVLFGVGTRIGQWLLPAPDTRVVVCTPEDADVYEACSELGSSLDAPTELGDKDSSLPLRQTI